MVDKSKSISVVLRPRRQMTVPRSISEQLGIKPGDALELYVEDSTLIAKPRKQVALDALREIREAFARSGITEEELLKTGRRIRKQIYRERYGGKK